MIVTYLSNFLLKQCYDKMTKTRQGKTRQKKDKTRQNKAKQVMRGQERKYVMTQYNTT